MFTGPTDLELAQDAPHSPMVSGCEIRHKSTKTLVHYLIDNVSKNGYLLLNVGPRPNGEIPEQAQVLLGGIGEWLAVNGEAIFGTTAWMTYGEGPTEMPKVGYFTAV